MISLRLIETQSYECLRLFSTKLGIKVDKSLAGDVKNDGNVSDDPANRPG